MSDQMMNPNEIQKNIDELNVSMESDILEDNFEHVNQNQINKLRGNLTGPAISIDQMGEAVDLDNMVLEREERDLRVIEKNKAQENAERFKVLRELIKDDAVVRFPQKTKLSGEFKNSFKSKVSDASRAKKQMNKRSRLFQKARNVEKFEGIENRIMDSNYKCLESLLADDQVLCEKEELADLSAFMDPKEAISQNALRLYLGDGSDQKNMNRQKALDHLLVMITSFSLGKMDLSNDKVLADNAQKLETLSMRINAFHSLAVKNGYYNKMDAETEKKITEKLNVLNSVVTYYFCRKEVINDPLYKSHYNEELSMDVTSAETPEQKALAEKLLRAHLAGVEMMKRNGADNMLVVRQFTPAYKNPTRGRQIESNISHDMKMDWDYEKRYHSYQQGPKPLDRVEKAIHANDAVSKELQEKAFSNMEHFEGDYEWQEGYKKEHYDPQKVMEYVNEMKCFNVSDIKFGSYRELINNYAENYRICERVSYLHSQISKAILYGYKDDNLKDADIMELRAIGMCFAAIKRTLCTVNQTILDDEKTAKYSDEQWDEFIRKNIFYTTNDKLPLIRALSTNPDSLLEECRAKVGEEEEEKEQSIKTAFRIVKGTDENPDISDEELKRRKEEYQRNALVQDHMANNTRVVSSHGSPSVDYLLYLEKKHGKKFGLDRMKTRLLEGKSAAEVERIYKRATGTPKEQFEFYLDLVKQYTDIDMNKFSSSNMGEYFENWTELLQFSNTADGEMKDITQKIREVMLKDETLTLPKEYGSTQELQEHCMVLYEMGQIMATKTEGFQQIISNKWLHAFSMKELGSLNQAQKDVMDNNQALLINNKIQVDEEASRYFTKLLPSVKLLNMPDPTRPGELISFESDKKAIYDYYKNYYRQKAQEAKKNSEEASKLSQKSSLIPVVSDLEYQEKKAAGNGYVMSEEQWKTYGGATKEKVVTVEEGKRIEEKSRRFLIIQRKKGLKGKVYLKPSMPLSVSVNKESVQLRYAYNFLIKSYMQLVTEEDGSFKKGVEAAGGICEIFDFITSGVFKDKSEENIAKAKGYLEEIFKPKFRQIWEESNISDNQSEEEKVKLRERATKSVQEYCDSIMQIIKNMDGPLISKEVSLGNQVRVCSYLMDTKEDRLKEIAAGFKFKETKMENGQEVAVERNATPEEISKAIAEMKEDVRNTYAEMKEIRDMDYSNDTVPIPNSATAGANLMQNLQKMVTKMPRPVVEHQSKNSKYEHHVGANMVSDDEEGLVTVEVMDATADQYMVAPFTLKAAIGQYRGKAKLSDDGKSLHHEGFSNFYNGMPPYKNTVKDELKIRLKDYLIKSGKEGLK